MNPMTRNPMTRMITATVILIVMITVFIFSYAVSVMPLEYVIDALVDLSNTLGISEIVPTLVSFPYFLAGAVVVGVLLMFVWYFAMAHKEEYEQY